MYLILSAITGLELVFVTCALVGGGFFIIRLVLMFLGFGHSGADDGSAMDSAHAGGADIHHDVPGHDNSNTDISFKTMSLQGLTSFFMMFGLVGWAMLRQSQFSPSVSILGAMVAGFGTVFVIKQIFQWAGTMQSSGTLNMNNAIGQQGTVYLTIHPGQTGKVQITVQGSLMILDARCEPEQEIKTGQPVRVVKVSNNTLIVDKA
jgi:membrane protein implicated in regulation of membrane protease activity